MARMTDPVCGIVIDSDLSPAWSHDPLRRPVYFCSLACQREYQQHTERYQERSQNRFAERDVSREHGWPGDRGGRAIHDTEPDLRAVDDRDLR